MMIFIVPWDWCIDRMPFIMTVKDWTLLRLRNKYYVYLRNRREHAEAHCIPVYRKKIHNITKAL